MTATLIPCRCPDCNRIAGYSRRDGIARRVCQHCGIDRQHLVVEGVVIATREPVTRERIKVQMSVEEARALHYVATYVLEQERLTVLGLDEWTPAACRSAILKLGKAARRTVGQ